MTRDSKDPLDHLPAMLRYARSLTRDHASADDLVQDALLKALRKRETLRGDNVRAWLLRIVHTTFLNDRRREAGEERRRLALQPTQPHSTEAPQDQAVRLRQLDAAFRRLPPDQRAALFLVTVEGLEYREAASVLEVPVGTLMSRLGRARAALRSLEAAEPASSPSGALRVVGGSDA